MKRLRALALLPMLLLSGCPDAPFGSRTHETPREKPDPAPVDATRPTTASIVTDSGPAVVALDVYQLSVPLGAVSRNDEFWKHVEESMIDAGTYDVMLKNDVRAGIGDNKDWPFFKQLIDQYHASAMTGSSSPTRLGSLELPMRSRIDEQSVFWWDDRDLMTGRTFVHCDNILTVSFEPHHRKQDHALIKVCPMIRGERKVGSSRVDLQACKLEYSIVSPK